jgi:hypothetical protein
VGTLIGVSGRNAGGLRGEIVASGRDSGGLGGDVVASGSVGAFVGRGMRLLACILGSNGCKAFLLEDLALVAQHKVLVARTLLAGFEASERKQESRRF